MANATYNTRSRGSDSHRREQDVRYLQTAGVSRPARRKKNPRSSGWLKRVAARPSWELSESTENAIICAVVVLAGLYFLAHFVLALLRGGL